MRLAAFIERDMEAILSGWETFARALPSGASLDVAALRDHAKQILEAVCKDIALEQTRDEQALKSKGLALPLDARETAAQTHALLRARDGFDINQMASEYRALRASVLRLWADVCAPTHPDLEETIRFNEAIDQALCESILFFSAEVDRARNLLLGILGHDMRNPLNAIQLTAHHLKSLNAGADVSAAAGRLIKNGARMKSLLDDLTDFNRTRLGLGITIAASETDLGQVFDDQIQELRAAHRERQITLEVRGDLHGLWDAGRLHQVLGNLAQNALRYGAAGRPVRVVLSGLESEVVFRVENEGKQIPPPTLAQMFEPLRRGEDRPHEEGSLGLGLYICREITLAHGGSIFADSTEAKTTFTVRLPRNGLTMSASRSERRLHSTTDRTVRMLR